MDWLQAGVTVGGIVGAHLLKEAYSKGRSKSQTENFQADLLDHKERLDDHDEQFRQMPDKFVSRQEITQSMSDMRDAQKRTNSLLDRILLRRAGIRDEEGS